MSAAVIPNLADPKLQQVIQRLVPLLHPVRVYVFGSRARGTAGSTQTIVNNGYIIRKVGAGGGPGGSSSGTGTGGAGGGGSAQLVL